MIGQTHWPVQWDWRCIRCVRVRAIAVRLRQRVRFPCRRHAASDRPRCFSGTTWSASRPGRHRVRRPVRTSTGGSSGEPGQRRRRTGRVRVANGLSLGPRRRRWDRGVLVHRTRPRQQASFRLRTGTARVDRHGRFRDTGRRTHIRADRRSRLDGRPRCASPATAQPSPATTPTETGIGGSGGFAPRCGSPARATFGVIPPASADNSSFVPSGASGPSSVPSPPAGSPPLGDEVPETNGSIGVGTPTSLSNVAFGSGEGTPDAASLCGRNDVGRARRPEA